MERKTLPFIDIKPISPFQEDIMDYPMIYLGEETKLQNPEMWRDGLHLLKDVFQGNAIYKVVIVENQEITHIFESNNVSKGSELKEPDEVRNGPIKNWYKHIGKY